MNFTINSISTKISDIYGERNKKVSFEYMYSYLTRKTSYLTREFIRDDNKGKEKLICTYIESLSWLAAISEKLDVDLELSFFKKFPNMCPYCISLPCSCSQTHRKPDFTSNAIKIKSVLEKQLRAVYINGKSHYYPPSMINDIYPANRTIFGIFGGFYHSSRLFEELGELQEAYLKIQKDKHYNKENINDELADILAWMMSLWDIIFKGVDLADHIDAYYINGCPSCNEKSCICDDYSGRIISTAEKNDNLIAIKKMLIEELKGSVSQDVSNKITASIESIDDAVKSGKESDERRTVNELKDIVVFVSKLGGKPLKNQVEMSEALDGTRKYIEE